MRHEAGLRVDRIEDVYCLEIKGNSVGTILISDTLEHVEDVHQATKEIHRVLKTRRHGHHVVGDELPDPRLSERLLEVEFDGDPAFPEGIYGFEIEGGKEIF